MEAAIDEPNIATAHHNLRVKRTSTLLSNRRMRTRMYGGVGGAVSNGGAYPIMLLLRLFASEPQATP